MDESITTNYSLKHSFFITIYDLSKKLLNHNRNFKSITAAISTVLTARISSKYCPNLREIIELSDWLFISGLASQVQVYLINFRIRFPRKLNREYTNFILYLFPIFPWAITSCPLLRVIRSDPVYPHTYSE